MNSLKDNKINNRKALSKIRRNNSKLYPIYKFNFKKIMRNNMKNILQEKKDILKSINIDDSRFIVNVIESFQKKEREIKIKKNNSKIIIKNNQSILGKNIIDLDTIWAKPYLYTKMRLRLEEIIKQLVNTDNSEIINNPSRFCKKAIFNNATIEFKQEENTIDIVEFIKSLNTNKITNQDFVFLANNIDEETLFKEDQITKAIEIIKINNIEKRNSKIYDEIYNYLTNDFISNNYCDFKNNKCVAQRKHHLYPINRKNGCCFTYVRTCPNLKNGNCNVECLACRLFSCPYLTKRGIGYWASDFIMLKAFFTKSQRKHLVFDFYQPKWKVLEEINKEAIKKL